MSGQSGQSNFSFCERIFFFAFLFAAVLLASPHAYAGAVFATDPCDADYYESLEARATLEAQREITQNQNLIFKPDSVLEYSCFDRHLNQAAQSASSQFSEDSSWGGPAGDMDAALDSIASAASGYDDNNFHGVGNNNMLGGRASGGYDINNSASSGGYGCTTMRDVWRQAKCMDFIDEAAHDGFFTFAEYHAGNDMRRLPSACPNTFNFQNRINTALVAANTPWDEDDVDTYFNLFLPATGGVCGPANARVRTGLTVNRTTGTVLQYNEFVCLVPGCYYRPSGMNTGSCVRP